MINNEEDNIYMASPATINLNRIGGGPILIMNEHNQPLHYLCNDGSKLLTIADHDNNDNQPIVLDKYHVKKLEDKKELESCIGDTIEVRAGKTKLAEQMKWEIINEYTSFLPKYVREKHVLGIRDKVFLQSLKQSDNPVAELFLYLLYGDKDKWTVHASTLNKKIALHNNSVKAKSTKDKR